MGIKNGDRYVPKGGFRIRERIISAFAELSRGKGFYRVTVDEVATQAGLSKRTIYRYFKSKDEIIEAVIDEFLSRMGQEVDKIVASQKTPEEIFTHILNNFFHVGRNIINPMVMQDLSQHYPHYWKKIDEFRMGKAVNLIKAFLRQSNRGYTREINPHIITTVVLTSIQAVLNPDFILTHGLTLEETVKQLLEFFKHGFLKESPAGSDRAIHLLD